MKHITLDKLLLLPFMLLLFMFAVPPSAAYADAVGDICAGVELGPGATCGNPGSGSRVNDVVELAINIFSIVVGVIAVFMVIISGLKYITSSGDSSNVTSAKNTLLYAVIGLIVVALAQILVRFVIGRA